MTDLELQLALAKMLPEKIRLSSLHGFVWIKENAKVEETEWLHVCWLVEQQLDSRHRCILIDELGGTINQSPFSLLHKSWQQRATALIAVKGQQ